MAHLIYQNSEIKGITLHGIENILFQFADDTSAYLQAEQMCLDAFTNTLSCVESQMGLKILYEKTTVYRISSLTNSDAQLYTQKNLKWSIEAISTLGVKINTSGEYCIHYYNTIIAKVCKVCNTWIN